jgi:hypothetical protein
MVCAWLGNSPAVARKNYLLTTEGDFERAIQRGTDSGTVDPKSGTESGTVGSRTCSQGQEVGPMNSLVETKKASENTSLSSGGQGIRTLNRFPGA